MAYSDNNNVPVNSENKDQYRNTSSLLPLVFRTEANKKFLGSTIDTLVSKGQLERVNGFVGSRYAKTVKTSDRYIPEPTSNRRRYNLLPSVVIRDDFDDRTEWTATYDDLINQLTYFNGKTNRHDRLFSSKFYAWNPHVDFDKLVNYRQYYWLPQGPDPVTVTGYAEGSISSFTVRNDNSTDWVFTPDAVSTNPVITLYRGATYKFDINAPGHNFYIKNARTTGTTDQYTTGVQNNGTDTGTIVFTVPQIAPDVLYYTCDEHQEMQGIFEIKNAEDELNINITTEILNKKEYTSANGVVFTNGLKVNFEGEITPSTYKNKNYYVEGVGSAIKLISESKLESPESYSQTFDYEYDIETFDETPFDEASNAPENPEYVTINRSSIDKNPWSRYNRWFHKDVIEKTAEYNNANLVLDETQRAKRPIIEFMPNIQLYNFATQALGNVDLIDTVTTDAFSDVEGSLGYYVDQVELAEGMRVTFNADPDITVKGKIYQVTFVTHGGTSRLHLVEQDTPQQGQGIVVTNGTDYKGTSWYFNGTVWVNGQQKTSINQAPLFELYNNDGVAFSDSTVYGVGNFAGNELVSYKIGTGTDDTVLGFPLSYQNVNNIGDITFEFDWDDQTFTYVSNDQNVTVDTASGCIRINEDLTNFTYASGWSLSDTKLRQRIVQLNDTNTDTSFIEVTAIADPALHLTANDIVVEYESEILKPNVGFTVRADGRRLFIDFVTAISADVRIKTFITSDREPTQFGFYEPPVNLTNNSENNDLRTFTLGSATDHFNTMFSNDTRLTGKLNSSTNARDLKDLYKYGRRYLKHQGSLLPAIFSLVDNDTNIVKAIRKNALDYNIFKQQFVQTYDTVDLTGVPRDDIDTILYKMSLNKNVDDAYYYSDMVGYGRSLVKLEYTVNSVGQQIFGIQNSFNLTTLSNRSVYVYYNNQQLINGVDYEFDATDNTVTVFRNTAIGDTVVVYDYDTTGNIIPSTPTKLGLFPKFTPRVYDDNTYVTTTRVIQGHDGSKTVAYGDYRDDLLLELEKRIYNNIKTEYNRSFFDNNEFVPGAFRTNDYTRSEYHDVLKDDFGYWANLYDIDYLSNTTTVDGEPFTYNYSSAIDTVNDEQLPGHWRAIFKKFYDTDRPHTDPWEMLGYTEKPSWWEDRYGPAPYTSGNDILWNDLEEGYDFAKDANNPVYARPGLSAIIPVDEYGDLKNPITANLVKNFVITTVNDDWSFGDGAPSETAWAISSWYPFAQQIALVLTKPAQYLTTQFDTKQNVLSQSGSILYNETSKIIDFTDVKFNDVSYNSTRFNGAGYHVFVTEYLKTQTKDVTVGYKDRLTATSMNLVYKIGGFANKERMRVLLESTNPNSADTSIFMPEENYEIAFRKSNPVFSAKISGVIVEKTERGYKVKGYDRYQPIFKIYKPILSGNDQGINIGGVSAKFVLWQQEKFYGIGQIVQYDGKYYRTTANHTSGTSFDQTKFGFLSELPLTGGASVQRPTRFESNITEIPYNTVLPNAQEVYNLLLGYEQYLTSIGFVFDEKINELGELSDWKLSGKEFLYWTTQNFGVGSVITLSPFAQRCKFTFANGQVDNVLDSFYEYSIYNSGGDPLPQRNISTTRESGVFTIKTVDTNQGIYNLQLNLVQKEHVIVFDDATVFGDIVYDQEAGYRQERIKLIGFKTTEWDGDMYSPGFVYDEAKISLWQSYRDYNLGDVVKYKTKYYSAKKFLPGTSEFDFNDWIYLGNTPVAELLPNLDYKISNFEDFYNLDTETFDVATASLSQHLVGYQKRIGLDNLIQDNTAQYKFYQGFIKEKGTANALEKISRLKIDDVQTDVTFEEEWAFKVGSLGSNSTVKEIEFSLDEALNVENPQAYDFVASRTVEETEGNIIKILPSEIAVKPGDYNNAPWPTTTIDSSTGVTSSYINKLPVAGYPRIDDIPTTAFDFDSMIGSPIINALDEGDLIWVAKDRNNDWNVYQLVANQARVIQTDDLQVSLTDNQLTLNTDIPHNLVKDQPISIKYFDSTVNGVYLVSEVTSKTQFKVAKDAIGTIGDSSTGVILEFVSTRVDDPDNINDIKNVADIVEGTKVYADDDGTGKWAVYEKAIAFTEQKWGAPNAIEDQLFGFNVVTGDNGRLIVVSAPSFGDEGQIYVLRRESATGITTLQTQQGYAISDNSSDNIVSDAGRPALGAALAISADATVIAAGAPMASNFKSVDDSSRVGFRVSEGDFNITPSPYTNEGVVTLHTYDTQDNLYKRNYIIGSPEPQSQGHFGQSIVVSDTKLVVGAPGQNTSRGNPGGMVYIFDKTTQDDGSTLDWELSNHYRLEAPNAKDGDLFGYSLAANSDLTLLAVGAPGAEIFEEDSSVNRGAVYVYRLNNNEYHLVQTLTIQNNADTGTTFKDSWSTGVDYVEGDLVTQPVYNYDENGNQAGINRYQTYICREDHTSSTWEATRTAAAGEVKDVSVSAVGDNYVNGYATTTTLTGAGSGLTVQVFATDGEVQKVKILSIGSGYSEGDTVQINLGDNDAVLEITSVTAGGESIVTKSNSDLFRYWDEYNNSGNQFGFKVSMSDDGSTLMVSAPYSDLANESAGAVYYFNKVLDDSSLNLYSFVQEIASPVGDAEELFGYNIAVNPGGKSLAVYSKGGKNSVRTTFDRFTLLEDSTLDETGLETTFDANSTKLFDENFGSGTVYTYSLLNTKFVFGQKIISDTVDDFDAFGNGLAFSANSLIIGAPNNANDQIETGSLYVYQKTKTAGWDKLRTQDTPTNPHLVNKAFTYNRITNAVKDFLEPLDMVKGKIPGLADAEISYKTDVDPATYTSGTGVTVNPTTAWTEDHVGELWWDLSTVRFLWYEQGDTEYRKTYWNTTFPGSSIDVYEWVETNVLPSEWNELSGTQEGTTSGFTGTAKGDDTTIVTKNIYNRKTGAFESRYFYWVKNPIIVPSDVPNRNIPAVEVASIINDPQAYGIKSLQLLSSNSLSVSNVKTTLSDKDIYLSIQYRNVDTDLPEHNEWQLISPKQYAKIDNELLVKKMIDSLVGYDDQGNVVPDTELPVQRKYGIQIRPRQTMFVNRLEALETFVTYVNSVMAKTRIVDTRNVTRLNDIDPQPSAISGKWDLKVDEVDDLDNIQTQDLEQASAQAVLVNGRLDSVTVTNDGFGYINGPEIVITGDGSGAKAQAVLDSSGRITSIEVLKRGSGYSYMNISIRPFKVLVNVDSSANNYWALYEWQSVTKLWSRTETQTYDVTRFWDYKDYVVDGFDTDRIIDFRLTAPYELYTIESELGDLVEVANAGDGNRMILERVASNGTFNDEYDLMFKANSTIEIKSSIYDYTQLNFGFAGLENFDVNLFDAEPILETRKVVEIVKDDILVDDLKDEWNELFFICIRYAMAEQSFVDWAFKTSFVNINNNLGSFSRKLNYKLSNPGYIESYIKEIKPYKSVIRNFVNSYDQLENTPVGTTDFDLPSYYDFEDEQFKAVKITDDLITTQPYINWFDNYKYNIGSIAITNQGAGYTENPLVVISGGRGNQTTITQTANFRDLVTTDYDETRFYISTSSVPDHGFARQDGLNEVAIQSLTYSIPRIPVQAQTPRAIDLDAFGVAVNGVVFKGPSYGVTETRNAVDYTVDAVYRQRDAGIADGHGEVQDDGLYFYNADPNRLYTKDATAHSPLLGYALDGFPIYGPYGWDSPTGRTTPRVMKSSYQLKTTPRADGSIPNGQYLEDYEYVAGLGDLDQHNGRTCNTPEYPNGTYAYFVTVDPTDTDIPVYPYILGPTYYGAPILPNGNYSLPSTQDIDAQAVAYTSRGIVREIIVTNPGSGYVSAPTVTLAGGGGTDAITETATAYAILENKKVRVNTLKMKFDRIATQKLIQDQTQIDTFTATEGQIKFKLTYLPTLDKRQIDININNETVYIENYDVSIVTATDRTYSKKEGYIIFDTPPGAGATVQITYLKSIDLMQATDRIDYYYEPTAGMLGKDPAQLMAGVEYDGVQVQGLEFDISVGWDGLPWMSHGWDTFSGENTDYAFRADGSTQTFTLPYVPESGQEINVYFDGVRQDPTNTDTIVGDGVTDTFTLDIGAPDGTLVVFRQTESDGSLVPTDVNNLDSIIQGGNFGYTTATGTRPEDISLDGDGFVTPDTSHAPEEVVPGQVFDSLSMSVYNAPADGSPLIQTVRYYGDSLTKRYAFDQYPGNNDSVYVTVAGVYLEQGTGTGQYTIDYENKEIVFVDAPEVDELVTIQTLNVGGSSILERRTFVNDDSSLEFELTAKFEDVGSAYVTVNGVSQEHSVIENTSTGGANILLTNPPDSMPAGSVVQVVALSSTEKTFSEIVKEVIVDDGSSMAYGLTNIPGSIAPYHAMVIVEMKDPSKGITRRLLAPDTVYYVSNGVTQDYTVSQDPDYPTYTLALGEIEVHLNGIRLVPIRDYNFNTATNLISFNQNVLTSGDAIAITILRNHEYELNVTGDSAGDIEGNLVLTLDRADIPANAEFYVTSFTNHDANLIRKEVFNGQVGGTYQLSRPALNSNYVWVEINDRPLVADRDYKVLDNNTTVYVDDKFNDYSTINKVVITTFSEEVSYDSIGYKVFKDMLNRTHFKRISEQDSSSLAVELKPTDETITLTDASFLQTPALEQRVPGVIWIDRERIEFYTKTGNVLGQLTRGTLGTGTKSTHAVGTLVFDGGPTQTVPYTETLNVYESIIRPGLPNGRQEHVLETLNISGDANAHDQVEVYLGGRKLQKPTPTDNPIKIHDIEIAFDSDETDSAGTSSDVEQIAEFTIVPVSDSTAKNYYKLVLRDEPQDGLELKVVQRRGRVWYEQGVNTASAGTTLQRNETAQAKFLLERPSGLPVINIRV